MTASPAPPVTTPATNAGSTLGALDTAVNALFERTRGNRAADTAALVVSNLADYGFVWAVLAAAKCRRPRPGRWRPLRSLAVAGALSAVTNAGLKRAIGRVRPDGAGRNADHLLPVRRPTSSSFPSGHTLASFCTALILADGPGEAAVLVTFATAVAASRVHLEAHHASDVLGGAVVGTALGLSAGWALRRPHLTSRRPA